MGPASKSAFTALIALCFCAGLARAQSDEAPGAVTAKHGAWSTVCGQPPGAPGKQCAIEQVVADKDQRDVQILIRAFRTADKKTRILQVLAPLGVLLPKGLGLFVDGKDIGRAYFLLCQTDGCEVEVAMDDDLMKTFKGGKQAVFTIYRTQETGIGFPVDLKGFGEGFDALP